MSATLVHSASVDAFGKRIGDPDHPRRPQPAPIAIPMQSPYKRMRISRQHGRWIVAVAVVLNIALAATMLFGAAAAIAIDEKGELEAHKTPSETIDLRATGIAHIDLPLGFRARFDAITTRNLYHSEDLAEPFLTKGPQLRYRRALESRISISRAFGRNIEFEIAWGARSRFENIELLNFRRQTFGALLRIVH